MPRRARSRSPSSLQVRRLRGLECLPRARQARRVDKTDLQVWVELQSAMQSLQKADGWDPFVQALKTRRREALDHLFSEGPELHDKNVGFIEGLDWVLNYPEVLTQQVEILRQQ